MYVIITALLETSDHDGYCSGNECEYKQQYVEKKVEIPKELLHKEQITIENYNWLEFFEEPELCVDAGSYFCDISSECENNLLGRHDYKYTVVKIEIVNK